MLHRSGGAVRYPARFQLVLAANPCPCAQRPTSCACAPPGRGAGTQQRLSGPLLDRIDLRVQVEPVAHAELFDPLAERETSERRPAPCRLRARPPPGERWRGTPWRVNADVPGAVLRVAAVAAAAATLRPAQRCLDRGELSARGFDRVLRLAWTIADLAGRDTPGAGEVDEALFYRTGRGPSQWAA